MATNQVAIYIRLSNEDYDVKDNRAKEESNSITAQRELLLRFIRENEILSKMSVQEFCDDGFSGTNFDRPQFQKMISRIKQGEFTCLIVKDFSRLGRDYLEVGNYMEHIFPLLELRFISVNDGYDSSDNMGTTSGLDVAFQNLIYHLYSRDLSGKVKSALHSRAKRGEYLAAFAKYGYKKSKNDVHKLLIDEEAADVVREIFLLAAKGKTVRAIAKELNQRHVPSRSKYRHQRNIYNKWYNDESDVVVWKELTIRDIITDEIYLGKVIYNRYPRTEIGKNKHRRTQKDEWIVVENMHEPIVSEEIFRKANDNLDACKKSYSGKKRYHTNAPGLIVCGYCKHTLQIKNKGQYYCYTSDLLAKEQQHQMNIEKEEMHKVILKVVNQMIDVMLGKVKSQQKSRDGKVAELKLEMQTLEKQVDRLKRDKLRLYESYKDGVVSKEEFLLSKEVSDCQQEEWNGLLLQLSSEVQQELVANEVIENVCDELDEFQGISQYDPKQLSKIIEQVRVYGKTDIEVVWKNADVFQRLMEE